MRLHHVGEFLHSSAQMSSGSAYLTPIKPLLSHQFRSGFHWRSDPSSSGLRRPTFWALRRRRYEEWKKWC